MYIKPNEETANSIIEYATNQDHLKHKFNKFRNEFQLKNAIYSNMIQFPADDDILLKLSNSKLVEYMSVIDITDDVPEVYDEYDVRDEIIKFLTKIEFDNLSDSICIISPFVGLYRSIIVEVFLLDEGLKVLNAFAEHDDELSINSKIDEFNSIEPKSKNTIELIENDSISKVHSEITEIVDDIQNSTKPGKLW